MHIHAAQPNTVSLLPQVHQTVCRGESISYNCAGNGDEMALFSPPIVIETNAILLFSTQNAQTSRVRANSSAAVILLDSTSLTGIFILYISDDQSEGQRTVSCRITSADGSLTNTTTFSVFGNVVLSRAYRPQI